MDDAFERLGMKPCLVISEEELREIFRAAGKLVHPDVGGGEAEFTLLNQAFAIISSPAGRLRCWMKLSGLEVEICGSIEPKLMDLFIEIGTLTQKAETLIRRRDEAKAALIRAMMEGETQICREALESMISKVSARLVIECESFPSLETSENPNASEASRVARNLVFLEKWKAALRSCYSRII